MRSPLARWKVRHLFGAWLGYWAVLAAVTLTPAAIAIWKVSGSGAKGSASINAGDGGLHAIVTMPGSTLWELSVPLTTVVLAIAGPPLVLWVCWLLSASASRNSVEQHPTEQLTRGDELPLRHDDRARDAML
jgi:hypothetical protein